MENLDILDIDEFLLAESLIKPTDVADSVPAVKEIPPNLPNYHLYSNPDYQQSLYNAWQNHTLAISPEIIPVAQDLSFPSQSSPESVPSPHSILAISNNSSSQGCPLSESSSSTSDPDLPDSTQDCKRGTNKSVENKLTCQVCGEKAGSHNYYGGQVCTGCRAFFRRAVQNDAFKSFSCVTPEERCQITVKTRRRCQYCRYHKCLEAGMKAGWVLTDKERTKRYKPKDKEIVPSRATKGKRSLPLAEFGVPTILGLKITPDDSESIATIMRSMGRAFGESMRVNMVRKQDFMLEFTKLIYFGGRGDYDFYRKFYALCDNFVEALYFLVDDFRTLPMSDCKELLDVNGQVMLCLKYAISLQERNWCFVQVIQSALETGEYPQLNEVIEGLGGMSVSEFRPELGYDQVFTSPWAASLEDEVQHQRLMARMQTWPRDSPEAKVDDVQMNLIKYIILFSTSEQLSLKRRDIVERVQMKFIDLLQKYLKFKYGPGEAGLRFSNGLMVISLAREVYEIQKRRLPV